MQAKLPLGERAASAASRLALSVNSLSRVQLVALSMLAVLLVTGGWVSYARSRPRHVTVLPTRDAVAEKSARAVLTVHVAGAVTSPGLYRLEEGSRVADALDRAGGPTPDAALDNLNLAARLNDGQKVMVATKGPAVPQGGTSAPSGPAPGALVNINTAGSGELESLPGVGPSLAARIIRYRDENGQFSSVDELDEVEGIGTKRLDSLRELVTI